MKTNKTVFRTLSKVTVGLISSGLMSVAANANLANDTLVEDKKAIAESGFFSPDLDTQAHDTAEALNEANDAVNEAKDHLAAAKDDLASAKDHQGSVENQMAKNTDTINEIIDATDMPSVPTHIDTPAAVVRAVIVIETIKGQFQALNDAETAVQDAETAVSEAEAELDKANEKAALLDFHLKTIQEQQRIEQAKAKQVEQERRKRDRAKKAKEAKELKRLQDAIDRNRDRFIDRDTRKAIDRFNERAEHDALGTIDS